MISNQLTGFEKFIVSKSNEFAFVVAKAVADEPGKKYNPVYFYGMTGSGKTHLLNSILGSVRKNGSENASLCGSQDFFEKLIKSISSRKLKRFEKELKSLRLLLIEDIQFFKDKMATQELLRSLFEEMIEMNIQVVLSGNVYPKELAGFDEVFISWIESGVVADIGSHDQDLRRTFILKTVRENRIAVSEDAVEWLSDRRIPDLRILQGALLRLAALSDFYNTAITIDVCRETLKNIIEQENITEPLSR